MGDEILYGTYRPVRHELSGRYVPYGSAEYRLVTLLSPPPNFGALLDNL